MRPFFKVLTIAATVATLLTPGTNVSASNSTGVAKTASSAIAKSPLTISRTDKHGKTHYAHYMPTVQRMKAICPATCGDSGPLVYHSGAPIMQTVTSYVIYWNPAHTQSGGATSMNAFYKTFIGRFHQDMPSHGLYNIATQYYQSGGSLPTAYVTSQGAVHALYEDTHAFPTSGCTDAGVATSTDCITDAQIQAEITRVMGANGWTGGLNKIFFLYTSSNEGSCFTSASTSCAYTQYCAYHSSYGSSSAPVIYTNQPYGNPSTCLGGGTNPYNLSAVAAVLTGASHEWQEAVTDPLVNSNAAWYTAHGNENGDLCAYVYGSNTWDGGLANQMWNGHFYELQEEWSNHTGNCLLVGP